MARGGRASRVRVDGRHRSRRAESTRRAARAGWAAAVVPGGRRSRLAERHGHRQRGRYVTDLDAGRLRGVRGRRQAGRHASSTARTCRSRWRSCRHEREHGDAAADRAGGGDRLRANGSGRRTSRRSSTSTAGSSILQTFTNNVAELEQAIRRTSAGGSTSMYNAIYIALKDLKKVAREDAEDDSASGDRRAVGRRRHVEPAAVRRGARSGEAIRDRDLRDRPAVEGRDATAKGFKEAEFVLRQLSQETGRTGVLPDSGRPS